MAIPRKKGLSRPALILFLLYAAVMIWLLYGKRWYDGVTQRWFSPEYLTYVKAHWHWAPLETIRRYARVLSNPRSAASFRNAVVQLIGNVVVFLPLGFLPPLIRPGLQSFPRFLLFVCITDALIELIQMATLLGYCEPDDFILNVSGASLGWFLCRIFLLLRRRRRKAKRRN